MVEDLGVPVASGRTAQSEQSRKPAVWRASRARRRQSWLRTELPAALGWEALISPLRPIPWAMRLCMRATRPLKRRPSRSPTPVPETKVLLSMRASSLSSRSMVASCQPVGGNFRLFSIAAPSHQYHSLLCAHDERVVVCEAGDARL